MGFTAYRTGSGNDQHSYFANPQFVNTASQDLHIQSSSPARNTAEDLGESLAGNLDMDREFRSQGTGLEIGADEFQEEQKTVQIRLFLEGAFVESQNKMSTLLNQKKYLPLSSPYSRNPVSVSSIPDSVVDWVLVDIVTASGTLVESKSAWLGEKGFVCDVDGKNGIHTLYADGSYHLLVYHRNHLAAKSAILMNIAPGSKAFYDFTASIDRYPDPGAAKEVQAGLWAVRCGDINQDGFVTSRDYCLWYNADVAGLSGYSDADVNLDGSVLLPDYQYLLENALSGSTTGI